MCMPSCRWRCLVVMGSARRGHPFISSITGGVHEPLNSAPAMLCAWCFTSTHSWRTALQGQVSSLLVPSDPWKHGVMWQEVYCNSVSHRVRALDGKSRGWMCIPRSVLPVLGDPYLEWAGNLGSAGKTCYKGNLPWSSFLLLVTGWKMASLYGLCSPLLKWQNSEQGDIELEICDS